MTTRRDDTGHRSATVRRSNLSALVRELHVDGPLTRSELGDRTGLTRSAVGRLVGELASAGLVSEEPGESLGSPGRPSPLVRPERAVALAFEIAVDSVAIAVVGLGGNVLERIRVDRPRRVVTPDDVVADLVALAEIAAPSWRTDALMGVGVAVVGVVRREDGVVATAPNLGWHDVALGEMLARALRTAVPVVVANEADLGALAEHRRGAGVGVDDLVFLSGEVGVGGGLVVGGRPLTGASGFAGEVGHLPVNPAAGASCRCGSIGCWETEVGEEALLTRAGRPADGGASAVEAILSDAAAGDPVALDALAHVGRWLGIGVAALVNVLNPARVVLGGRFARLHPFVAGAVCAELDRRTLTSHRATVGLVAAGLGPDAALLGAAELAFESLLTDPSAWIDRSSTAVEPISARRSSRRARRDVVHTRVHHTATITSTRGHE